MQMDSRDILDVLRDVAGHEESTFFCGGYIQPSEELSVVFEDELADGPNFGKLAFPYGPQQSATLEKLVKTCSAQSTPGQGGSQGNILHLDAANFTTSFEPAEYSVLEDVRRILAPAGVTHVRLKRERLIVCQEGSSGELGHATEHDQYNSFGKLALVFPISHTGGEIVVRHKHSAKPFFWDDGGTVGKNGLQWVAFLNKCSADVEKVTKGCFLAITYQLLPTYASKRRATVKRRVVASMGKLKYRDKNILMLSNMPEEICCGGSFSPAAQIAIHYYSLSRKYYELQLPLREAKNIQGLIDACCTAPFGQEGVSEPVHDSTYRKALKLDSNSFWMGTNWHQEVTSIVEEIRRVLVPNAKKVTTELYKLNVYGQGDFFKPHVDTPRQETMFGSLVICLPVPHTGGDLVVRHNGKSHTFCWGTGSPNDVVHWAAFFSDCEHEVTPVTSGHRVTLTYNLYGTEHLFSADLSLELNLKTVDPTTLAAYQTFCTARDDATFMPGGSRLAFACKHRYPHVNGIGTAGSDETEYVDIDLGLEENMACMLKGADAAIVAAARAAGLLVRLLPLWTRNMERTIEKDWKDEEATRRKGEEEEDGDACEQGDLETDWRTDWRTDWTDWRTALEERERKDPKLGPSFCKFLPEKPPRFKRRSLTWCTDQFQWQVGAAVAAYGNEPSVNYFYSAAVIVVHIPPWDASTGARGTTTKSLLDDDIYASDSLDDIQD